MIFDNPAFPADMKARIYAWLDETAAGERKDSDTDEQFHYKTRKKALGHFKKELWGLPQEVRESIADALQEKFTYLLSKLRVNGTRELAEKHAPLVPGSFPRPAAAVGAGRGPEDTTGLSD